jgi:purine-binding chemotaxis protein CheW
MSTAARAIAGPFGTFTVADLLLGMEVAGVQEVIANLDVTPAPLAAPEVAGLINLRGQIIVAIDLRQRLGLARRQTLAPPINVIVRAGEEAGSLLVDEMGDVLSPDPREFEPPPPTLPASLGGLVRGVYPIEGRLLLILDAARAVAAA